MMIHRIFGLAGCRETPAPNDMLISASSTKAATMKWPEPALNVLDWNFIVGPRQQCFYFRDTRSSLQRARSFTSVPALPGYEASIALAELFGAQRGIEAVDAMANHVLAHEHARTAYGTN